MKPAFCFVAAALAAFCCVDGAAASASDTVTAARIVEVQDLDLASKADRAVLDRRIRSAARNVCRELLGSGSARLPECINQSVERAQPQRDARVERHAAASEAFLSRP